MIKYIFLILLISSNLLFPILMQDKLNFIHDKLILLKKNNWHDIDDIVPKLIYGINNLILETDLKEKRKLYINNKIECAKTEIIQELKNKKNIFEPLISFIMPCYNREKTIREALDSIYAQELEYPFEVICVDDASTDTTLKILKEYENKYDNFFVYKHLINKKAPATRNTAIAHARGKYIYNVDTDNVLMPGIVNNFIELAEEKKYDVVYANKVIFFEDFNKKNIQKIEEFKEGIVDFQESLNNNELFIALDCKLFTKKSWQQVGGFLEEPGQDSWGFNYTLLANGNTIYIANSGAYFHRIWNDNSNMWRQEHKEKLIDVNPLKSIKEYPEILSNITNEFVKEHGLYKNSFLVDGIKRLKLINRTALTSLHKAYKYEESNDFKLAEAEYKNAISLGVEHINVFLKLLKICIENQNFEDALNIFNKIKNKNLIY